MQPGTNDMQPDSGQEPTAPGWQPPQTDVREFFPKRTRYCVCITVLNEGDRLRAQLQRMKPNAAIADIVIADGRSTDGATDPAFLEGMGVRTLLSTHEKGLSTATRMAVAYAIGQGYDGIVTMDGNGKDGVEALPDFLVELDRGCDLVQGSRFMAGGFHENTPWERRFGIKCIVVPLMALACGHRYTDTTNAFRALSMRFLADPRVQPVRGIFVRFNLQLYFIYRAAALRFKVTEIPVKRVYPGDGTVPTKIVGYRVKLLFFKELFQVILGKCNP